MCSPCTPPRHMWTERMVTSVHRDCIGELACIMFAGNKAGNRNGLDFLFMQPGCDMTRSAVYHYASVSGQIDALSHWAYNSLYVCRSTYYISGLHPCACTWYEHAHAHAQWLDIVASPRKSTIQMVQSVSDLPFAYLRMPSWCSERHMAMRTCMHGFTKLPMDHT